MLFLKICKYAQVIFEDLCSIRDGIPRQNAPVSPDLHGEFVVIGDLADTSVFNQEVHLPDRGEDRVYGNDVDRLSLSFVALCGNIPTPMANLQLQLELAILLQGCNVQVGVQDLNIRIRGDMRGSNLPLRELLEVQGLGVVNVQSEPQSLKVEDDIGYIFFDSRDTREFMQSPGDSNRGHRSPLNRGEEDTPKRITNGQAEPTFKGLRKKLAVCAGQRFQLALQPLWLLEALKLLNHQNLPHPPLFGVQRNNQLLLHGDGDLLPRWDRSDGPFHVGRIKLQPTRQRSPLGPFESRLDCRHFATLGPHLNGLARTNPIRRNVRLASIHEDVTVGNQYPRLRAGHGKSEAMDNAVQPLLQNLDEVFTRNPCLSLGQAKVFSKLCFQHSVDSAHLLLLA